MIDFILSTLCQSLITPTTFLEFAQCIICHADADYEKQSDHNRISNSIVRVLCLCLSTAPLRIPIKRQGRIESIFISFRIQFCIALIDSLNRMNPPHWIRSESNPIVRNVCMSYTQTHHYMTTVEMKVICWTNNYFIWDTFHHVLLTILNSIDGTQHKCCAILLRSFS